MEIRGEVNGIPYALMLNDELIRDKHALQRALKLELEGLLNDFAEALEESE
jgi:hypothetical protein